MYEISNYARPGYEARHNLTYWRGQSYLGIGAGAHSYAADGPGGRRWWNERLPAVYVERAHKRGMAEAGGEDLDAAISAAEFAFLNLRLLEGLEFADFERFGVASRSVSGRTPRACSRASCWFATRAGCGLSERGLELADSVFAEFLYQVLIQAGEPRATIVAQRNRQRRNGGTRPAPCSGPNLRDFPSKIARISKFW